MSRYQVDRVQLDWTSAWRIAWAMFAVSFILMVAYLMLLVLVAVL